MIKKTSPAPSFAVRIKIKSQLPAAKKINEMPLQQDIVELKDKLDKTVKVQGWIRQGDGLPREKATVMFFPWQKALNSRVSLKEDHWDESEDFVPNRRQVGGVYGVAQPTEAGIKSFLHDMGSTHRKVYWFNMRAEPTIFIKGESYTLRTKDERLRQLEYQGATPERIEQFENAMRREIRSKIKRGEPVNLCYDNEEGVYQQVFKPGEIKPQEVKTMWDVLNEFSGEYEINYKRVPVNDRYAITRRSIDELVKNFKKYDSRDAYVINCMLGRGRTVNVMTLLNIMNNVKENPKLNFCRIPGMRETILEDGKGRFKRLRRLLRVARLAEKTSELVLGRQDNENFQTIIDGQYVGQCHLLEGMPIGYARDHKMAKEYLKGYLELAMFYRYCRQETGSDFKTPYSKWVKKYDLPLKAATEVLDLAFRAEDRLNKLKKAPKSIKIPGFPNLSEEKKKLNW